MDISEIQRLINAPLKPNASEWAMDVETILSKTGHKTKETDEWIHKTRFHDGSFKQYTDSLVATLKRILREMDNGNQSENEEIAMKNNKVFIVHGHNNHIKERIARILNKLELEPIILSEQPNKGKTIIEKLEIYSNVRYVIVIYSSDDLMNDGEIRGRQNVVFEHGLFIGKLGRENVMCIRESSVKLPGDIDGIVYTDSNEFENEIVKELKASGVEIDANLLYQ